jgi:NADH-quinone oxidoreductase subunit N
MAIALFSLAGIPPTAGFFGKLFLIMAGAAKGQIWFIVVVVLNLVVSLYYYLRVVRAIFMDANERPIETVIVNGIPKFALLICTVAIITIGLIGWIYEHIQSIN